MQKLDNHRWNETKTTATKFRAHLSGWIEMVIREINERKFIIAIASVVRCPYAPNECAGVLACVRVFGA